MLQGWGRIINTGSMHALVASPYKSAYNAAKHGIAGFTKTVALELAQKNITCNAICPGYVLTGTWWLGCLCVEKGRGKAYGDIHLCGLSYCVACAELHAAAVCCIYTQCLL